MGLFLTWKLINTAITVKGHCACSRMTLLPSALLTNVFSVGTRPLGIMEPVARTIQFLYTIGDLHMSRDIMRSGNEAPETVIISSDVHCI